MNALPILLLGGAALLMMNAGKKNGKKTNGTKTNGVAKNGYTEVVYAEFFDPGDVTSGIEDMVGVQPGQKFLVKAPEHPSGSAGIWDISYNQGEAKVTKKSNREWVIESIEPITTYGWTWDVTDIVFDARDPHTNEIDEYFKVRFRWAGEPPEGSSS
jgi:hypothetical protein